MKTQLNKKSKKKKKKKKKKLVLVVLLCFAVPCFILCKKFVSVVSCVVLSHVLSCVKGLGQLFLVLYCLMFYLV